MRRHDLLVLAVAPVIGLCCGALQAQSAPQPPASAVAVAASLQVVLFDVAPYASRSVDGALVGVHVERVRELVRRAGLRASIRVVPFARVPLELQSGSADISLGFATEALSAVALAVGPVAEDNLLLVARKGQALEPLEALNGRWVGRARGGCTALAERDGLQVQWSDVSGFASGVRMLSLGRLDALCLTASALDHARRSAGLGDEALGETYVVQPQAVLVWARKDLPQPLLRALVKALPAPATQPGGKP